MGKKLFEKSFFPKPHLQKLSDIRINKVQCKSNKKIAQTLLFYPV